MKYLKKFENHTQYEEARQNLILPNVSLCAQENEVHYNPIVPPYQGFCKLTLNDSSVVELEGNGELTNKMTQDYKTSLVGVETGVLCTSIGVGVFSTFNELKNVKINNSVTSIDVAAFYGCVSLTNIDIPNSVTSIGTQCFDGCTNLSSITIGSGITSIGWCTFNNCNSLTSIVIPNSVISVDNAAFQYCTSLTSVTIGNSVTSIGAGTFSRCISLTEVTIPNSVTSIGESAFYNCSGLTSVTIEATTPPTLGGSPFSTSVSIIYVPAESVEAYKTANIWINYSSMIRPIPTT